MDTPGVIPYQLGRKLGAPKSFLTGPQRSLMEAELGIYQYQSLLLAGTNFSGFIKSIWRVLILVIWTNVQ